MKAQLSFVRRLKCHSLRLFANPEVKCFASLFSAINVACEYNNVSGVFVWSVKLGGLCTYIVSSGPRISWRNADSTSQCSAMSEVPAVRARAQRTASRPATGLEMSSGS